MASPSSPCDHDSDMDITPTPTPQERLVAGDTAVPRPSEFILGSVCWFVSWFGFGGLG